MREPCTIGEVMTPAPFTIEADAPLRFARSILLRARIHHLPVLERGRPIGLLTDRDLHLVSYLSNDLMSEDSLTAGDICVPDPYVVGPEAPLAEVTGTLARDRLGAAMIVVHGGLAGIFTCHDACRLVAEFHRAPAFALDPDPALERGTSQIP